VFLIAEFELDSVVRVVSAIRSIERQFREVEAREHFLYLQLRWQFHPMEVVLRAVVLGDDSFGGGEVFSFYDVVHADGEVPPRSLQCVLVVLVVIRQVVHQIKLCRRQRVDGVVFEFIQHFVLV